MSEFKTSCISTKDLCSIKSSVPEKFKSSGIKTESLCEDRFCKSGRPLKGSEPLARSISFRLTESEYQKVAAWMESDSDSIHRFCKEIVLNYLNSEVEKYEG